MHTYDGCLYGQFDEQQQEIEDLGSWYEFKNEWHRLDDCVVGSGEGK